MLDTIIPKPETFLESILQISGKVSEADAQKLCLMRKLSWDKAIVNAINATRSVDLEELLAHLEHATLPFNDFWMEGPTFLDNPDYV